MSVEMMAVLEIQVKSLSRQVDHLVGENDRLGVENDQVRRLLTDFNNRHDADKARIEHLQAQLKESPNA